MTCIVAIIDKKKNRVIMGGDSAASSGYDITIRKDTKIFKNGEFIIGCTSSFRMIQLLRFSLKIPDIKQKDIYHFMCTDFVDSVRDCFLKGGFLQKSSDGDDKGGIFLVGYKNRLFTIHSDFQVAENKENYSCIGCGEDFALATCYNYKKSKLKKEIIIKKALKCAAKFSNGVSAPFNIIKT